MSQNESNSDILSFKRFTMGSISRRKESESHPGLVNMLDRSEVKMLTQILHLDNTGVMQSEYKPQIEKLIQNLPKRLRRPRPLSLNFRHSASGLCDLHLPLNGDLISNIFCFVQREVTEHFLLFEKYPDLCHPVEGEIISRLRVLRGMWTKPGSEPPITNAWNYQINGCRACMLARVASDMEAVRNLRVVILSRTRTRKNHRPRTLMAFVDECINQFSAGETEDIYHTSGQLGFGMKAARKACTKADYKSRGVGPRHGKKKHRHHSKGGNSSGRKSHQESKTMRTSLMKIPEYKATGENQLRGGYYSEQNDGILSENVDSDGFVNLVDMYKAMGEKSPFSRGTPVPSAMVEPLNVGEKKKDKKAEGTAVSVDKDVRTRFTSITFPSKIPLPKRDVSRSSRDIPVKYQYAPSDYSTSDYPMDSSSDWMDDECTDSDGEFAETSNLQPGQISEVWTTTGTTWDLLSEHHNMI